MDNEDRLTLFNILKIVELYSMKHKKRIKSARMTDALYNLPKEITIFQNATLPPSENFSDDLQGEGVKTIIPSNIIGIYTRLETLLGLKISGHTNTLAEASNLLDELYKIGEFQNEKQYRNALNNFFTL